jgi:hypothetical protein
MKRPCLNTDYMVYASTTQPKGPHTDMKGEEHFEETGLINHTPVGCSETCTASRK